MAPGGAAREGSGARLAWPAVRPCVPVVSGASPARLAHRTSTCCIQQKFLRKKYKDPITGGDFELKPVSLLGPGSETPGVPGMGNRPPGAGNAPSGARGQTSGFGSQSRGGLPGTGMQGDGVQPGGAGIRYGGAEARRPAVRGQPFGQHQAQRGLEQRANVQPVDRRSTQQEQGPVDPGAERTEPLRSMGVRLRAVQSQPFAARRRAGRHRDSSPERRGSSGRAARGLDRRLAARSGQDRVDPHSSSRSRRRGLQARFVQPNSLHDSVVQRGAAAPPSRGLSRVGCTRLVSRTM